MDTEILCRNCGTPLRGEYCSQCGQREGRGDLKLGEVAGELVGELFNWDSRFWRTFVPLIFRPGFLTAEFIAGRRARYVPPFRLYLIVSFVLFLVVSLMSGAVRYKQPGDESVAGEGVIFSISAPGIDAAMDAETGSEAHAAALDDDIDMGISLADKDSAQWLKDLEHRLEANVQKIEADPAAFLERLTDSLPQMMFLLLPLFALLLEICYLFSPFQYLQHLVFSLHYHSFVYLLYLFGRLGNTWLQDNAVAEAYPLVALLYLPLALKRTYNSSIGGAIGKSAVIVVLYALLLLVAFAGVSILTLALL